MCGGRRVGRRDSSERPISTHPDQQSLSPLRADSGLRWNRLSYRGDECWSRGASVTLSSPLLRALAGGRSSGSIEIDGQIQPDFRGVADSLRGQIERFGGGAAVCVYHRGELVVDLWGGYRDPSGTPWLRDTMAPSFSTTKGVASTLIHVMADRGLIDYEEPVATYWPEFAQAGKSAITIRQVLAHQSGL